MGGPAFAKGDVVILKSGGPKMTVREAYDDEIACTWFDEKHVQKFGNFEPFTLVKAE